MENKITKERVIDGTFFSNLSELIELMDLLLSDTPGSYTEPKLETLKALMETQKDYYILLVWENADLSRITFDTQAAADYYNDATYSGPSLYELIMEILQRRDLGYHCKVNAVDGLRMADYDFHESMLSDTYMVSRIEEKDFPDVLALYEENPGFLSLRGREPSIEAVREDANRIFAGCEMENKYYVILRDPDPVAVIDVYLHYPRQDAIWIDLIVISKELQGLSYGSEILRDMLDAFAKCGFMWAEAGYVIGNQSAERFFRRNWFVDLLTETKEQDGTVWRHMIRGLQ